MAIDTRTAGHTHPRAITARSRRAVLPRGGSGRRTLGPLLVITTLTLLCTQSADPLMTLVRILLVLALPALGILITWLVVDLLRSDGTPPADDVD